MFLANLLPELFDKYHNQYSCPAYLLLTSFLNVMDILHFYSGIWQRNKANVLI